MTFILSVIQKVSASFIAILVILVSSYPDFLEWTFSMTSLTSTAVQLKFLFLASFLLLGQLRDLKAEMSRTQKSDF